MPLVPVNGVRLLVGRSGAGPPLVLVHGSWDNREAWALVEDELARSFLVVSYDRRGHAGGGGRSEDGPPPGSRRQDEDDLAGLIEWLGAGPAHLAANSYGGSIALALAARRPELVRSVCAHEPALVGLAAGDPAVERFMAEARAIVPLIDRGEDEAAAHAFMERIVAPGAWDAMTARDRATMASNARTFADEMRDPGWGAADPAALAAIACPVLLTRGGAGSPAFAAVVARLAGIMPRARVRVLPGAGHIPHATHPAQWIAAVRAAAAAEVSRS